MSLQPRRPRPRPSVLHPSSSPPSPPLKLLLDISTNAAAIHLIHKVKRASPPNLEPAYPRATTKVSIPPRLSAAGRKRGDLEGSGLRLEAKTFIYIYLPSPPPARHFPKECGSVVHCLWLIRATRRADIAPTQRTHSPWCRPRRTRARSRAP